MGVFSLTLLLPGCSSTQASPSTTSMSDRKAVIKNADMSEEMQQDAVDCATHWRNITLKKILLLTSKRSLTRNTIPPGIALLENFGSYVTHETRHFIYFYLGQV